LWGLTAGVAYGSIMFLFRPLFRREAARSQVRLLLYSETLRASSFVLMGLAFGLWFAAVLVLLPLRAPAPRVELSMAILVFLLFMSGTVAFARIGTQAAKRLARQLAELRGSAPSR
jgi:hypothetical protein